MQSFMGYFHGNSLLSYEDEKLYIKKICFGIENNAIFKDQYTFIYHRNNKNTLYLSKILLYIYGVCM